MAGPPAAAEPAGLEAALTGDEAADAAAAVDAAADVGAADADVEGAVEDAAADGVDAVLDFDELQPAANSRPEAASTPSTR